MAPTIDVRAAAPPGSDFAPLMRRIRDAGLLERRRVHYARLIAGNALAYCAVWAAFVWLGDTWWTLALAVPAAIFTARTCFLGHDAGHAQIARTRRANRLLGLVHGNLMIGMSYGWWTDKHNKHHANPNHVDKDPDVAPGVLVWTTGQAEGRGSRAARWFTRNQARMFFPLLLLEGINLKVSGVRGLNDRPPRERALEGLLLVAHAAWYFGLIFTVLSPGRALVFIAVHQGLLGLHLGCSFAPNHKGMAMPDAEQRLGHLERQVLTSRNVRGGPVVDWMLGGLNYQIEHHLFPNMPRPNLRRAQPVVRAHCMAVGLPYVEAGVADSYAQALRHMDDVGEAAREN
jgi:fatty acid desaturase